MEHFGALCFTGVADNATVFDPYFGDGHLGLLEMKWGPGEGRTP